MICDRCHKKYPLFFQHISWINMCELCFSKKHQNWFRETWRNDFECMYDWHEWDELYEYYLDIIDLVPNEEIDIELDEDGLVIAFEEE